MPYDNVPEDQWDDMDRCVEKVMAEGHDKESAIGICYASVVEGKSKETKQADWLDPFVAGLTGGRGV